MPADNVATVRRMWSTFEKGGLEAALEFLDEDIEWVDDVAAKTTVHGHDGFREAMSRFAADGYEVDVQAETFAKHGEDGVLVQGYVRLSKGDSYTDLASYWAYRLSDGKVVRGASYSRPLEALEAAGQSDPAS